MRHNHIACAGKQLYEICLSMYNRASIFASMLWLFNLIVKQKSKGKILGHGSGADEVDSESETESTYCGKNAVYIL